LLSENEKESKINTNKINLIQIKSKSKSKSKTHIQTQTHTNSKTLLQTRTQNKSKEKILNYSNLKYIDIDTIKKYLKREGFPYIKTIKNEIDLDELSKINRKINSNNNNKNKNTTINPINILNNIFLNRISEKINIEKNFKFTNEILNNIIEEIRLIDNLENKVFNNPNDLLFEGSFIKLTRNALAAIIKISNLIENLNIKLGNFNHESKYKIAKDIILKIIISQIKFHKFNKINTDDDFVKILPKEIKQKDIEYIYNYVKNAFRKNYITKTHTNNHNNNNDSNDYDINLILSIKKEIEDVIKKSPVIIFDFKDVNISNSNNNNKILGFEKILNFTYEEFYQKFLNFNINYNNTNNNSNYKENYIEKKIYEFFQKFFELYFNNDLIGIILH
jgi:hypothetical protein